MDCGFENYGETKLRSFKAPGLYFGVRVADCLNPQSAIRNRQSAILRVFVVRFFAALSWVLAAQDLFEFLGGAVPERFWRLRGTIIDGNRDIDAAHTFKDVRKRQCHDVEVAV